MAYIDKTGVPVNEVEDLDVIEGRLIFGDGTHFA